MCTYLGCDMHTVNIQILLIFFLRFNGYFNMPPKIHLQRYIIQSALTNQIKSRELQADCRYLRRMSHTRISIHTLSESKRDSESLSSTPACFSSSSDTEIAFEF